MAVRAPDQQTPTPHLAAPPVNLAPLAAADGAVSTPPQPAIAPADAGADTLVRRRNGYLGAAPSVQIGGVAQPGARELDTNGIPITRRKGAVADVHSRVKGRPRPPRPAAPEALPESGPEPPPSPALASATIAPRPAPVAAHPVATASAQSTVAATVTLGTALEPRHERPPVAPVVAGSATVVPTRVTASPPTRATTPAPAPRATTPPVPYVRPVSAPVPRASYSSNDEPSADLIADIQARHEEWRTQQLKTMPERRCASCRSFRASDTPGRGWCVNPYAFPTQQLVASDDLACLTGLGTWWVESDAGWQSKAGATTDQPTPLADGLIQLLREARRGRRPS